MINMVKLSHLDKLKHIQHQFVVGEYIFKTFDGKLADCKIGVCTVEKLQSRLQWNDWPRLQQQI